MPEQMPAQVPWPRLRYALGLLRFPGLSGMPTSTLPTRPEPLEIDLAGVGVFAAGQLVATLAAQQWRAALIEKPGGKQVENLPEPNP